jgi:hypothetical protein
MQLWTCLIQWYRIHQIHNAVYCHAFSDHRRVLDWQSDLLHLTTNYNWVSLDSLQPTLTAVTTTTEFLPWRLFNSNSELNSETTATLVTAELNTLQPRTPWAPFSSLLGSPLTHSAENSEVYDLWTDCREDSAFGIVGCLAITRKRVPSGLGLAHYQATSTPRRARHNMLSVLLADVQFIHILYPKLYWLQTTVLNCNLLEIWGVYEPNLPYTTFRTWNCHDKLAIRWGWKKMNSSSSI